MSETLLQQIETQKEVLQSFMGVFGSLTAIIVGLIIIAVFILIFKSFWTKKNSMLYGALLACIFLLIIVALACIVFEILTSTIDDKNVLNTKIIDLSMIMLVIALSGGIPFLVANALTDKQINAMVEKNTTSLQRDVRVMFDKELNHARAELWRSDADDARMIGYLLMTAKEPDYIWSLSWLLRAVKSKIKHTLKSEENERTLSDLFMRQCMSFITYDLCKIYELIQANQLYLSEYEKRQEISYLGTQYMKEKSLVYSTTICRVLRDLVDFYCYLDNNKLGITKYTVSAKKLKNLIAWLTNELYTYIQQQDSHTSIGEKIVNSTYLGEEDTKEKVVFTKKTEGIIERINQKTLQSDIQSLLGGKLKDRYPAFES